MGTFLLSVTQNNYMKKGLSVGIWIWIIGGVLIAGFLFVMVFYNLALVGSQKSREFMVDQFETKIVKGADYICSLGIGSVKPTKIKLKGVQAIYAAKKPENVNPKAPLYIVQGNRSYGNYLCISFSNTDFICEKLACKVNITYMGTPMKGTDMYNMGITDGYFDFDVSIEKKEHGKVLITGTHIP